MRRRRFKRSFAGRAKNGRAFYWFRFDPFFVTQQEASSATHSDILLQESDWQNPSQDLNQTQKGGARLERFIMDYGLAVEAGLDFFRNQEDANIALIPEFMVWKQPDQLLTLVTDQASFIQTRRNMRVIMDEVPFGPREFMALQTASNTPNIIRSVQGRYETKSKVRLSDGALGVAWIGRYDETSTNLLGWTDWVRPTLLISMP